MLNEYYAYNTNYPSAAYRDKHSMINASNFALYVVKELSKQWDKSLMEVYQILYDSQVLEDDVLYHHNALHQDTYENIMQYINNCLQEREEENGTF